MGQGLSLRVRHVRSSTAVEEVAHTNINLGFSERCFCFDQVRFFLNDLKTTKEISICKESACWNKRKSTKSSVFQSKKAVHCCFDV